MNSALTRGLILTVLITCSFLIIWWLTPSADEREPRPTPSAMLTESG